MKIFIICILVMTFSHMTEAEEARGVIFHGSSLRSPDDLIQATEYANIKMYNVVVHITPVGAFKPKRILQTKVRGIISYPDLFSGSITNSAQITELNSIVGQLKAALNKFPKSKGVIDDSIKELIFAQGMLDQGNILVQGLWKSKAQVAKDVAKMSVEKYSMKIDGREYFNPHLKSTHGDSVGVGHSSGVAKIKIASLSKAQIESLNKTNDSVKIDVTGNIAAAKMPINPSVAPYYAEFKQFQSEVAPLLYSSNNKKWEPLPKQMMDRLEAMEMKGKAIVKKGSIGEVGNELNAALHSLEILHLIQIGAEAWEKGDGAKAVQLVLSANIPQNTDAEPIDSSAIELAHDLKEKKAQALELGEKAQEALKKGQEDVAIKYLKQQQAIIPEQKLAGLIKKMGRESLGL